MLVVGKFLGFVKKKHEICSAMKNLIKNEVVIKNRI